LQYTIGQGEIEINSETHMFYALTMIDTVTNLTELAHVSSMKASNAAEKSMNWLLFRYPGRYALVMVIKGQEAEFAGDAFQRLFIAYLWYTEWAIWDKEAILNSMQHSKLLETSCML
jgi:hypothetical protein